MSDERAARSHANAPEHLVDLTALDRAFVLELFAEADRLRAVRGTPKAPRPLAGKTAALVFHKPSLRTRVSFSVGMHIAIVVVNLALGIFAIVIMTRTLSLRRLRKAAAADAAEPTTPPP